MQDITENLRESERAVEALGGTKNARWLQFNLVHPDGVQRETDFFQDTLGMMPLQDLFNKFRAVIKSFVDGEYGIKLGELFRGDLEMPDFGGMSEDEVDEAIDNNKGIVLSILKVIEIVPELELDVFAYTLGVDEDQHAWFKKAISQPPHRGGLKIGEGFDILRVFIRQNAKEIRDFFTEEGTSLAEEFKLVMAEEKVASVIASSTGGTPSSTTSQGIKASD